MKTIKLLLLALLMPMISFAQKQEPTTVDFLGVDFSYVDVIGAKESEEQFQKAFKGINTLLHTEANKYDVAKFLKVNVDSIDTQTADERVELHASNNNLAKEDSVGGIPISEIIEAYPSKQGYMLLIIATEFNKTKLKGSYMAIIFDGESKDMISMQEFSGKPGGFGLRNFWAGSLYNGLKSARKSEWMPIQQPWNKI